MLSRAATPIISPGRARHFEHNQRFFAEISSHARNPPPPHPPNKNKKTSCAPCRNQMWMRYFAELLPEKKSPAGGAAAEIKETTAARKKRVLEASDSAYDRCDAVLQRCVLPCVCAPVRLVLSAGQHQPQALHFPSV